MYALSFTLSTAGCISGTAMQWSQEVGLMQCCPCRENVFSEILVISP